MKKSQILIITIVVALILLGGVGFAVVYFATDTFKTDQEMFYKYANQMNLELVDLENYNTYLKRLEEEKYSNQGEITFEIVNGQQTMNEAIKYTGYTNPANQTAGYDVSINKDNQELLALKYLKNRDLHGVQFKNIINQYIVLDNNNLKDFATKLGAQDTSIIPDRIKIPESKINYDEANLLLNQYLKIAMEEIPEDKYSKIEKNKISLGDETVEADGYQIKLNVKDLQKIFSKVLENAREDEKLFNLLNSNGMTFEEYHETVNDLIMGLSQEIPDENNVDVVTVSVYKKGKNAVKLSVMIEVEENVNVEIALENTEKGSTIKLVNKSVDYNEREIINTTKIAKIANTDEQETIEIVATQKIENEEKEVFRINCQRNGALTSDSVGFGITFNMNTNMLYSSEQTLTFKIAIQNSVSFADSHEEEQIVAENHLVINQLPPEQVQNLFTNLGKILAEKLKDELFVSIFTTNINLFENAENASQEWQNAVEEESQLPNITVYNDSQIMMQESIVEMEKQEKEIFNAQFALYEGESTGNEIKNLYNIISTSNGMGTGHMVVYTGVDVEILEGNKKYNVSFNKDEEGYINQVIVKEI